MVCPSTALADQDFYEVEVKQGDKTQKVYVRKTPLAERLKYAPSKLRDIIAKGLRASGRGAAAFPVETYEFYKIMGAFAVWDCTTHYRNTPSACMEFLGHATDPVGYVSFAFFMGANHGVQGVGQFLGKSAVLASSGIASNLIWSNLGLAAGSMVSAFVEQGIRDEDMWTVASYMWRRYAQRNTITDTEKKKIGEALVRLEKKWWSQQTVDTFAPQISNLLASAFVSGAVTKAIFQGTPAHAKSVLGRALINGASSPEARTAWTALVKRTGKKAVFAFKPWIVDLPILRSVKMLTNARFATGPTSMALFFLVERTITPVVQTAYNNSTFSSKYYAAKKEISETLNVKKLVNYGDVQREWRAWLMKNYTERKASWDSYTTRVLSDIDSTFRFYSSFLLASDTLSISTQNNYPAYVLKAIEQGVIDWQTAGLFSVSDLYYMIEAKKLGLSKDFYIGVFNNPNTTLAGIVNILKGQSEFDRTLSVEALNAGISIFDVIKLDYVRLEELIAERTSTENGLPALAYNPESLIGEPSLLDMGAHGPIATVGGMTYLNMSEKLLASILCGPDVQSGDLVSLPVLGFGIPMFNPPKIVSARAPGNPCGMPNANATMSVRYQNQTISLIDYAAKNIDPLIKKNFFDQARPWFFDQVVKRVEPTIEGFKENIKLITRKNLAPIVEKHQNAFTLQNVFKPSNYIVNVSIKDLITSLLKSPTGDPTKTVGPQIYSNIRNGANALPNGLMDSLSMTRLELSELLLKRAPEASRKELATSLLLFEKLMNVLPSELNKADWQTYWKNLDTNEDGDLAQKTSAQIHRIIGLSLISRMETAFTNAFETMPAAAGQAGGEYLGSILNELAKLNYELLELDMALNI